MPAIRDVEAFEAAAGFKVAEFTGWGSDADATGHAVAAVKKSGVDRSRGGLRAAADTLRSSAEKIDEALAEIGLAPRPEPSSDMRPRRERR